MDKEEFSELSKEEIKKRIEENPEEAKRLIHEIVSISLIPVIEPLIDIIIVVFTPLLDFFIEFSEKLDNIFKKGENENESK